MPVLFDSSASDLAVVAAAAAAGNASKTHPVSQTATNLAAIAALYWVNSVDVSAATFGATFGGQAMTLVPGSQVFWNSNKGMLALYFLMNPPTGPQTVEGTFSGVNTAGTGGLFGLASDTYSGVASVGSATTAVGSTATTANSVTVPSIAAAHRVVCAHALSPQANTFAYNQIIRSLDTYTIPSWIIELFGLVLEGPTTYEQLLLLGDAPGAADVTSTATMSAATANWAASGVSLAPAPVVINASGLIGQIAGSASLKDLRVQPPSPLRTWIIPTTNGALFNTYGNPGPQWEQADDSVLDYTLDWSQLLAGTGDSIAHATFTPSDPSVSVISVNTTDTTVTGWLTGGVNGRAYTVTVHIVTLYGRQDDRTFTFIVNQT